MITDPEGKYLKYALIGEKLGHSYSKTVHEKYFSYKSMSSSYELIEIPKDNFELHVSKLLDEGYAGYNVTIPYKVDIMGFCSEVCDEAKKIGSVNTIKISDGKMYGYNTDYYGLKLALEYNHIELKNKDVVILGTGGASKAVSTLCEDLNCKSITLVSRTPSPISKYPSITYTEITRGDIIINTTPVGMYPNVDATPFDKIDKFSVAVDLIYNPAHTLFLKRAKENCLKTVNGLYMLVAQAIYSQSIWNNTSVDLDIISKIYSELRGK